MLYLNYNKNLFLLNFPNTDSIILWNTIYSREGYNYQFLVFLLDDVLLSAVF